MRGLKKMIHAYDEVYIDQSMENLAFAFDYATNWLKIPLVKFWEDFLKSPLSNHIEIGNPTYIAGKSGIELVNFIYNQETEIDYYSSSRSKEYWLGYVLAYYQWYRCVSFKFIDQYIKIKDILYMYYPYHEMDISQFVDKLDEFIRINKKMTNLKIYRLKLGLSQSQLAEDTNIPLRTIQQYEQGQKNINNANAEYLVALSTRLFCSVKDLLEY